MNMNDRFMELFNEMPKIELDLLSYSNSHHMRVYSYIKATSSATITSILDSYTKVMFYINIKNLKQFNITDVKKRKQAYINYKPIRALQYTNIYISNKKSRPPTKNSFTIIYMDNNYLYAFINTLNAIMSLQDKDVSIISRASCKTFDKLTKLMYTQKLNNITKQYYGIHYNTKTAKRHIKRIPI